MIWSGLVALELISMKAEAIFCSLLVRYQRCSGKASLVLAIALELINCCTFCVSNLNLHFLVK